VGRSAVLAPRSMSTSSITNGVSTQSEGRCGVTSTYLDANGHIIGATVDMWETQRTPPGDCIRHCRSWSPMKSGMSWGLEMHMPIPSATAQSWAIVHRSSAAISARRSRTHGTRRPNSSKIDRQHWRNAIALATRLHCEETLSGSFYCPGNGESPIIIDFNDDGYNLTDLANGVWFDLNADGRVDRTAWTTTGSDDAFLCRDRDGNGSINDGSELFGNSTPLADGTKSPERFRRPRRIRHAALRR